MYIYFCRKCNLRVPHGDLETGRTSVDPDDYSVVCVPCLNRPRQAQLPQPEMPPLPPLPFLLAEVKPYEPEAARPQPVAKKSTRKFRRPLR